MNANNVDGRTPAQPGSPGAVPRSGLWEIFATFAAASLTGFGGMLPQIYRGIVERRRWLTATEFAGLWTVAVMLPGAAVCNLAVIVAYRRRGLAGVCVAMLGTIAVPAVVIVMIGAAALGSRNHPLVDGAIHGMSAAAAGVLASMAVRLREGLGRYWHSWLAVAIVFVAIGVLRLPFLGVVAVVVPLSVWMHWRRR